VTTTDDCDETIDDMATARRSAPCFGPRRHRRSPRGNRCRPRCVRRSPGPPPGRFMVPTTVISETAWQLETNVGGEADAALVDAVIAGELPIVDIQPADYVRAVELLRQYADMRLGLVDASAVALAERLGVRPSPGEPCCRCRASPRCWRDRAARRRPRCGSPSPWPSSPRCGAGRGT